MYLLHLSATVRLNRAGVKICVNCVTTGSKTTIARIENVWNVFVVIPQVDHMVCSDHPDATDP